MIGMPLLDRCACLLATALLMAFPAFAQPLATYETRSIVLLPEQVAELAGRSYWTARLAKQSHLTLIGGKAALAVPEALLAAISTWLPAAPPEPPDWVFALTDSSAAVTGFGARATLASGDEHPDLKVQPLELDQVVELQAAEPASGDWRPGRAFLFAGFPDGIEPYCNVRAPVCAATFGWAERRTEKRFRDLVTVSRNGSPTTFHVQRPGAGATDAGDLVRYLGEVGVTHLTPPPGFSLKDGADLDLELEQSGASDATALGPIRGLEKLALRERVAVKSAVVAYHQTGTRSAEADVVLPAGPAGQALLYTFRFLPTSNEVTVEAFGAAANVLPAEGPRSDVRRIPGFPAGANPAALRDWLKRRYPAVAPKGASVDEIVANANRLVDQASATADWFATNYAIAILGPKAADRRLADVHARTTQQRGGLKTFSAFELRALEAVLQTLGDRALALVRGTALVRQRAADGASVFGDQSRTVQIAGLTFTRTRREAEGSKPADVASTIAIYDVARSSSRFIGGRTPDGSLRVYPPVAAVIAHEFGHVIGQRAPAQKRFNDLVTSMGVAPFTRYAASSPENEFFPEAFALFLLDPAWVRDNHPDLYARVLAYAQRPRPDAL